MSLFQILTPLEWFAFVGVPSILVLLGWGGVKAAELSLHKARTRAEQARQT